MANPEPQVFERELLARIVRWAAREERVRAVALTSSRVSAVAPVDALSDYDVALVVGDAGPFLRDRRWLEEFGEVLARQAPDAAGTGAWRGLLVLYAGGFAGATKVDFTLTTPASLAAHREAGTLPDNLDVGYRVLLDKDDVTAGLAAPTYRAHVAVKPTAEAFRTLVEDFFFEATYVAKNLWRGEIWPAKHSLEAVMKQEMLRRMLEWRVSAEHGWAYRPGKLGRGLREALAGDVWAELAATFVGFDRSETWRALFASIELFRRVAREVGARLGVAYPDQIDRRMMRYLRELEARSGR